MDGLAEEGFVLFAGPLAATENGRLRALVIVNADSEQEIYRRLATDPWTRSEHLQIVSIELWNIFVGIERLSEHAATA
jgi:uncharacterized protein YciI